MPQFWHDNITEKSFQTLAEIKGQFKFILIGGWAVYLYSKKMKSKDIDIIIDYGELEKLKNQYPIVKNERLKKYEINLGEFDIDIYLPHYSAIGYPLEKVEGQTQNLEGFVVPKAEILLALKLFAFHDRKNSLKGQKDQLDILGILNAVDIDWPFFRQIAKEAKTDISGELLNLLKQANEAKELGLSSHYIARLKEKIIPELTRRPE